MPNYVFLAVPMAILCIAYWVYDGIKNRQEQTFLRAVYDGDRIQQWKSDRWNAKHAKITVRSGRCFY